MCEPRKLNVFFLPLGGFWLSFLFTSGWRHCSQDTLCNSLFTVRTDLWRFQKMDSNILRMFHLLQLDKGNMLGFVFFSLPTLSSGLKRWSLKYEVIWCVKWKVPSVQQFKRSTFEMADFLRTPSKDRTAERIKVDFSPCISQLEWVDNSVCSSWIASGVHRKS